MQKFGDRSWTQDKLERVRKYLVAYTKIMRRQNFRFAYIDAFAGTGYHELKQDDDEGRSLFAEIAEPEVKEFLDGSARIALQVEPRFTNYVFVEKDEEKVRELAKLRAEFPDRGDDIEIIHAEANAYLQNVCANRSWKKHRAVLFLDPFGMQVSWRTMEAIARTEAIDTWILFPIGAVNRLLKRDGRIPDGWRHRLDTIFGEPDWYDAFFPKESSPLFKGEVDTFRKVDVDMIGKYFNQRLGSVFADVAPNPLTLRTRKNSPIFLLCFAAANPNASDLAIKIAQDILGRPSATPFFPSMD